MNTVYVRCTAAVDLNEAQIRAMIDPGITVPSGGILKAWVAGHEGVARPAAQTMDKTTMKPIDGFSPTPVTWGKSAVGAITKAIKIAAAKVNQFWDGHPKGAEDDGSREKFGRIVGGGEVEKNGTLYSVVVGHFADDQKAIAEKSDIVSMEALWRTITNAGQIIATGVDEIFGFALASSKDAVPGFPGAHEIRAVNAYRKVYCFSEEAVITPQQTQEVKIMPIDWSTVSFEELKQGVRAKGAKIHQLFEPEDAFGVQKVLADGSVTQFGGSRTFQEHLIDVVAREKKALQDKVKELEPFKVKSETQDVQLRRFGARSQVEKAIDAAKLPEPAMKYLRKKLDQFDPGEKLEDSIPKFITDGKAEFEEIFGPIKAGPQASGAKPTPRVSTPAADSAGGAPQIEDETPKWFGSKIDKEALEV